MAGFAEIPVAGYFKANRKTLSEGFSGFVDDCRERAIGVVVSKGYPGKKDEKYRYCDTSRLLPECYAIATLADNSPMKTDENSYRIELTDGLCAGGGLTVEKNGVVYGSLKAAFEKYKSLTERFYDKLVADSGDIFANLNTAFAMDGLFVLIPKGVNSDKPFAVALHSQGMNNAALCQRMLLVLEEGASLEMVVENTLPEGGCAVVNSVKEIFIGKNSTLRITEIQYLSGRANSLITTNLIKQEEKSCCSSVMVTSGDSLVRNNHRVILAGMGAENNNNGLYICREGGFIDNYTDTLHSVPDCTSRESYRGVVAGDAKAAFTGRIEVAKDAQRTAAALENHNLVLSDDAVVYSRPQLEIYADDVKCSHGSTTGQLDPEALFYIRQRGIDEEEAKKLQIRGFACGITREINNEWIAERVDEIIGESIDSLE